MTDSISELGRRRAVLGLLLMGLIGACEGAAAPERDDSAASTTGPTSAAAPAEVAKEPRAWLLPPHAKARKEGVAGWECQYRSKQDRVHCGVLVQLGKLYLGGPVGTRFQIGGEEIVLTEADPEPSRAMARWNISGVASSEVYRELEFPSEARVRGDLSALCDEGRKGVLEITSISVTLPGDAAPLEARTEAGNPKTAVAPTLELTRTDLWIAASRRLEAAARAALEGSEGPELPPLAEGAGAILHGSGCVGGEVKSLADLRYVVLRTDSFHEPKYRRESSCGTYRGPDGKTMTVKKVMYDQELELVEVRTGKRLAKKIFRAPRPKCPKEVKDSVFPRTITSNVPYETTQAWVEKTVAQKIGE